MNYSNQNEVKVFTSPVSIIKNPLYVPVHSDVALSKHDFFIEQILKQFAEIGLLYNHSTRTIIEEKYIGLYERNSFLIFTESADKIDYDPRRNPLFSYDNIDDSIVRRFELDSPNPIIKSLKGTDIVVARPYRLNMKLKNLYKKNKQFFFDIILPKCIESIDEYNPDMVEAAEKYLSETNLVSNFCFIMRTKYYKEFCNFLVFVFRKIKNKVDVSKFTMEDMKFARDLSIFLLGVFATYYGSSKHSLKICEKYTFHVSTYNDNSVEIQPVFPEDSVNIILSSSDYFSPYLCTCIHSIIDVSSDNNNYDIIIIEREIKSDNKNRILQLAENRPNISIRFFNVTSKVKDFNFYINSDRLSQETYYGLLMPWILPQYHRAIIMDCDMIAKYDLAELYYTDIGENIAGGVCDIVLQGWLNDPHNDTYDYYTKQLKILNPFKCFNGGLILLDFDKYREGISQHQVQNLINSYQLRVVDQDIFNILLEGKVALLDVRWNHMIYLQGAISDSIGNAPASAQCDYFESQKNPFIIHFASENKPWINPDIEFAGEFWKHARQTLFYEAILARMIINVQTPCQSSISINDPRSSARKIADIFLPINSKRRKLAKFFLPKGSLRWRFCKQIYYIISPQYRPLKKEN